MRMKLVCVLCAACLVVATLATAEVRKIPVRLDVTKSLRIELPAKDLVKLSSEINRSLSGQAPELRLSPKKRIETPTKTVVANSADAPKAAGRDRTKRIAIELPTKRLVNAAANLPEFSVAKNDAKLDQTKSDRIEPSTIHLVGVNSSSIPGESRSPSRTETSATSRANPKVAPGKVVWHESFEAACAASRKSGKPVLLFQMMGNLDDQFC